MFFLTVFLFYILNYYKYNCSTTVLFLAFPVLNSILINQSSPYTYAKFNNTRNTVDLETEKTI